MLFLHHYGVDVIVHPTDYKGVVIAPLVLGVNDHRCSALSGLISSFTPYRFKGVATEPLVLGVNDWLGCSVCTIRVLTSNCALYRYIDSTFWQMLP